MKYTMQRQHFHKAKLMSIFWSNSDKNNQNHDRYNLIYGFRLNEYFYSLLQNNTKFNINHFCRPYKSENFMFSYFVFNETENTLGINTIENNFEDVCISLLLKEKTNSGHILNHIVTDNERDIILRFFCLQSVRNPDRYIDYQNRYFSHLMTNTEFFNPYYFDLFDFRNLEQFLIYSNSLIISDFYSQINFYKDYCFKIFQNINKNNILTDNCIINLNQNDYLKNLYKEKFDTFKEIFNNINIMVLNETYSLIFYPHHIHEYIHIFEKIFLDNQILINLFSSRNIVYKKDQQDILFNNIKNALSLYNKNNIFLKNYMDLNFSRDQLEKHIIYFYQFKSQGLSYLS